MQIISTIALYNYKVPVIVKKNNFTFCPGNSRENSINIFQDFPGHTNEIQGLSRTFQDSKKNPALFQDVATLHTNFLTLSKAISLSLSHGTFRIPLNLLDRNCVKGAKASARFFKQLW